MLEETNEPLTSGTNLLAAAYQMTGNFDEAKKLLQVSTYNHMCQLISVLSSYLAICTGNPAQYEEVYRRIMVIVKIFNVEKLHPTSLMSTYIAAAQGYITIGKPERALDILDNYTQLVTSNIYPLKLQGDEFFHLLDGWLEELPLGTDLPRDEKLVRQSMVEAVVNNPAFAPISEDECYKSMVRRLKCE